jgi:hypothetical protein
MMVFSGEVPTALSPTGERPSWAGAFGTTFRMRNVCDDRLCAVKVLDIEALADAGIDLDSLKGEAQIMVRISQEDPHHFVQYFTSFYHEDEDRGEKFYCIVMEL